MTTEQLEELKRLAESMVKMNDDRVAIKANPSAILDLLRQLEEAKNLAETLKQQAQIHAMEARTMNAIVAEIYQLCTGSTGEPGNWNGAEPVRQLVADLEEAQAENDRMRKDAERYRFLRDIPYTENIRLIMRDQRNAIMDSAIDAALAKEPK